MTEAVFFWIFAVLTVAFAARVVLLRNPVHAAMSLVAAFFFLAGIYVLLAAHLIAILQVMVYAGAVMVLFVFVIMLLNLKEEELGHEKLTVFKGIGLVAVLVAVGIIAWRAFGVTAAADNANTIVPGGPLGGVEAAGDTPYVA